MVWRENDFPYSLEPGVEHHNLWASAPLPAAAVEAVIAERRPAGEWEVLWFVNPPVLMSVPLVSGGAWPLGGALSSSPPPSSPPEAAAPGR